ncbi:Piso0_004679 [Millerozyma farinosa CBS 7064]|uniref:Piso0_004679 protein n=1 Tax=Pichia sorbitophila (strain ATCC MYA-4447 / BCRC 22081 / CBS 7064 / NBRC 10061 / NRRL Y-12695) TaxID=559304 RepID=G8Y646_PICSO|nr:Piso0_004679 [Millerozyma farinosa CBS 7064]CCE85107.1 Piso0_004679 [Millerozyma farinosa CBS 7064]
MRQPCQRLFCASPRFSIAVHCDGEACSAQQKSSRLPMKPPMKPHQHLQATSEAVRSPETARCCVPFPQGPADSKNPVSQRSLHKGSCGYSGSLTGRQHDTTAPWLSPVVSLNTLDVRCIWLS